MKKKDIKKPIKNVINKNMTFSEILEKHPESIEVFLNSGMHCIGCPASTGETLEEGAIMHGINPDKLVKELNKKLLKKNRKK